MKQVPFSSKKHTISRIMSRYESDDSSGPVIPHQSASRSRKGWEGESLELQHEREAHHYNQSGTATSVVAVDLNQFRNTEVGKGYQAKHVIRQRTHASNIGHRSAI